MGVKCMQKTPTAPTTPNKDSQDDTTHTFKKKRKEGEDEILIVAVQFYVHCVVIIMA